MPLSRNPHTGINCNGLVNCSNLVNCDVSALHTYIHMHTTSLVHLISAGR